MAEYSKESYGSKKGCFAKDDGDDGGGVSP
jgi:hypothetical protein